MPKNTVDLPKFSGGEAIPANIEHTYGNVWARDEYDTWSCLRVGADGSETALLLRHAKEMEGPFLVVYVLLTSRLGREPGRYESPLIETYDDLELFLWTYNTFLENDGRHHLWVISTNGAGQLIFDNHNFIYVYGDLEQHERLLAEAGFKAGVIEIPSPHAHHFHPEFDEQEDELFSHWSWAYSPLRESDEP